MLSASFVLAAFLSSIINAFPQLDQEQTVASAGVWQKPNLAVDHRAPCPGLNSLANHGFINRNGSDIQLDQLRHAFTSVYRLAPDLQEALISGLSKNKNVDTQGRLDLNFLRRHNPATEHDASLVHDDAAFGPSWITNQTLVTRLLGYSIDGKSLTIDNIARYRIDRENESAANNPSFTFTSSDTQNALLESAALIGTIGNGTAVSVDVARVFLSEERLPMVKEQQFMGNPQNMIQALGTVRSIQSAQATMRKI